MFVRFLNTSLVYLQKSCKEKLLNGSFSKAAVRKCSAIFTGKLLCWGLFLINQQGKHMTLSFFLMKLHVLCTFNLRPVSTVKLVCFKERLKLYNLQKHIKIFLGSSASVFTVSFTKFLRTPFLKNTSGCFCYCYIENKFYLNQ